MKKKVYNCFSGMPAKFISSLDEITEVDQKDRSAFLLLATLTIQYYRTHYRYCLRGRQACEVNSAKQRELKRILKRI